MGGSVSVAVADGSAEGVMVARSSALICRTSVANVGVSVGVNVAVGELVAEAVAVKVAVGEGVIVGVLVVVSVGRTALVGNTVGVWLLSTLTAKTAITAPINIKARSPTAHFFTRSTPVFVLAVEHMVQKREQKLV